MCFLACTPLSLYLFFFREGGGGVWEGGGLLPPSLVAPPLTILPSPSPLSFPALLFWRVCVFWRVRTFPPLTSNATPLLSLPSHSRSLLCLPHMLLLRVHILLLPFSRVHTRPSHPSGLRSPRIPSHCFRFFSPYILLHFFLLSPRGIPSHFLPCMPVHSSPDSYPPSLFSPLLLRFLRVHIPPPSLPWLFLPSHSFSNIQIKILNSQ